MSRESGRAEHPNMAVMTAAFAYTGGYVDRGLIDEGGHVRTLTRLSADGNPLGRRVEEAPLNPSWVSSQPVAGSVLATVENVTIEIAWSQAAATPQEYQSKAK